MKLYNYFRSSASYRVRIALALKGLSYEYVAVHLVKNEQLGDAFRALAPSQLVPALVLDAPWAAPLTQSLAIIEYLEETHPEPPLLPADALGRARVRAIALDIACEIHPLDNLRVLRFLVKDMGVSDDDKNRWYRHWVETGLETVERQFAGNAATGRFAMATRRARRLRARAADPQRPAHELPSRPRADGDARHGTAWPKRRSSTTQASACPDAA
jgi:maleylacetoacetate isomerase/maleylpyruvate isomerase